MNSDIHIQFLGCGDAFGSGGRSNTCFYVSAPSTKFLIDCGASSLVALKKYGIPVGDIDFVIITHFHGDHYGGLPFLVLEEGLVNKRTRPLTLIGPPGLKEKLEAVTELLYPGLFEKANSLELNYHEYEPGQDIELQTASISSVPVVHSKPSIPHGIRISLDGKVISYSGDTSWTDNLLELSEGSDLFVCECNFYDQMLEGHLNYHTIRQNEHRFNTKRLILTHFGEEMLRHLDEVELECATDGLKITI